MSYVVSRDGLKVAPIGRTGVCEFCGKPCRLTDLDWVDQTWVTTSLRRGHVIATLCPRCWYCGALTGRDDLCRACWEAGVA